MKKLFTLALACILAFASFAQEPGEIDTNFGTDGVYVFHPSKVDAFGYFDYVYKVLVQEDGKILTIGEARTDGYNYAIYVSRHNTDGTLDETYGEGGYVFLKVDPLIYRNCPNDAVIGENGMLYLAGHTYDYINNTAFVVCLDENGFENEDYGDKGYVVTEYGGGIVYEAIDIDSKGRCVVVGYYNDEILVRRFNAKGKLDMTFGKEGTVNIELDSDPNAHSYAYDVKILDNGKIILCGDKRVKAEDDGFFIWSYMMRLKSNGDVDDSFGENGVVYLLTGEYAEFALSIAEQPNGKYLVGGHDELWSTTPEYPRYESFVTRVNTDGTIDETFGEEGYVKIEPFQGDGNVNYSYSILAAQDGQIFGTVYSWNMYENLFRAYVYNLTEDGQFNENFAGSGIVPLPKVYEEQEEVKTYSIALQGNDKIIVAGCAAYDDPAEAGSGDYTKIYLARINVDVKGEDIETTLAEVNVDANATSPNTIVATFTPNENTTEYHVGIYTQKEYDESVSELVEALKADGKPLTGNQEITFEELVPNTEYVVLVAAKNAESEWNVKETYVVTMKGEGFEEMQNVAFNIHPNPATTTIFVESAENAQVNIIDLTGRCVKEVVISNTVSSINIEDVESGVYFISVQQGDNNYVEKLVVK